MIDRPSTVTALRLSGIGFEVGASRILAGVSLSVTSGEMLGVIGPNGAGKTTLFNIISGLLTPTAGQICLGDHDVTRWSVQRRSRSGLGRTFQSSTLFDGRTVLENVRLAAQVALGRPGSLLRFPRRDDAATTGAGGCLEEVGLTGLGSRLAGALGHGEKRKVEIAMALAAAPEVVLLDEPLAGVAAADIDGVAEVIGRLHAGGRTVLMVEHNMDVVLGLAERVAVLHHGELLACDRPAEVMADPTVQSAYLGEAL